MELLREGQIVRGTYEVERLLGQGAFGVVYRVRHKFLGLQSMKVFKTGGMSAREIENVLAEAVMLSKLLHPNIIRVFDADTLETPAGVCGFFTMEYVAGGSLDSFWRAHSETLVPIETAVDIARQICRGLALAHSQDPPIAHRDIKPENILVGYDAQGLRIRVSDFGLAKHVNPLTMRLSVAGTPWFKAPEVFSETRPDLDSCAGDIWGVGSTLYLMLTDRLPYDRVRGAVTRDAYDRNRFDDDLVSPRAHNGEVDSLLERIVVRALSKGPESRYPTAKEFLKDLEAWRPGGPPAGRAPAPSSADFRKDALGAHSSADEEAARGLAGRALVLARDPGRLAEASDLLEQAITAWPPLAGEFGYRMKLWRRGITM